MKKSFRFFLFLFLLFISFESSAQIDTKFWFAPPDVSNVHDQSDNYIELRLASVADVPVTVTITQPANPGGPVNFTVPIAVGQSYTLNLSTVYGPYKANLETVDGAVRNTGLFISSTGPITAYYEVGRASSIPGNTIPDKNGEIFSLKGSNALGTRFYTPFQNIYSNNYGGNSSIDIVATEDNTVVSFKLTRPGVSGGTFYNAGTTYTINLNKGQTYSIRANGTQGSDHMSGSEITSNKPIAVTQKDDSVQSSWDYGADIIGDQLVPVDVVGTEYVVARGFLSTSLGNPPYDRNQVFIVPTVNGTNITVDGVQVGTNLAAGSLFTYVISSANANAVFGQRILSNNPIYVYYVSGYGSEMGGPLLPPLKCTGSAKVSFVRSSSDPFFLTILARKEGIGNFLVEGRTDVVTAADFTFDAGNGWVVAQKRMDGLNLPAGIPVNLGITVENTSSYFHLGIINGKTTGGTSRFGYFSDFGKIESKLPDLVGVCPGKPVPLDPKVVGLDSAKTKWYLLPDDINPVYTGSKFNATKDGKYKIVLVDSRQCSFNDTVSIASFTVAPFKLPKSKDTVCYNVAEPINVGGTWTNVQWTATPPAVTIPANTLSYSPTKSGIYQVTVTDANTCQQKDQVEIVFDESLKTFDLGPDNSTVCFNVSKPIVVGGGPYRSVKWNAPVVIPDGTTSYDPRQNGLYKVTVGNTLGCFNSDQVTVTYSDGLKTFDLGPDNSTICFNVSKPIVVNGGPYGSVKWTAPVVITDGTVNYDPKQSGIYKVTVGDAFGCFASDQVNVNFDESLKTFDLGPDNSTVCFNVSKPIKVTGSFATIKWAAPAPVVIADGTVSYDPLQSGLYKVTVTNTNGCSNSDQVNVNYADGLKNFDLGAPTSTVCFNVSKQIVVNGGPYSSIKWSAPLAIADGTTSHDPKSNGVYKVTVGDAFGCSASDQVTVTYDESLKTFDLGPDNSTVCFNVSKPIVVSGGPYASIVWTAPVVIPNGTTNYDPKQSGTFKVSVSNSNGCANSDQVAVTYSDGLKTFDLGPATSTVCFNVSKPIVVSGGPYSSIDWTAPIAIASGVSSYDPKQSGVYKVTVGDAYGCKASDQITVAFDESLKAFDLGPGNSTVCFNVSKPIVVPGGPYTSIIWAAPIAIPNGTTSFDPKQNGTFKVTVSNSAGCSNNDQVVVSYADGLKNFDLGPGNSTVCFNVSKPINVPGGPYSSIEWAAPVSIPAGTNSYDPKQNGTFKVTVGDVFGCKASDQVVVAFDESLKSFDLGPDNSTVCFNASKPIVVGGGPYNTIQWTAPAAIPDGTTNYDPKQNGIYKVTVGNTLGCFNSDQVNVVFSDGLKNFGLTNGNNPVCFNETKPILVSGGPFQRVSWSGPEVVASGSLSFNPKKSGTFAVTVGDVYGCAVTKQVDILYVQNFGLDLGKKIEACIYTGFIIDATKPNIVSYEWSTDVVSRKNKLPAINVSSYKPDTSGTYAVKITDVNGCADNDTLIFTLVNDLSVNLGSDRLTCSYENFNIDATGNYLSYEWSNDAGLTNPPTNVSKFKPVKSGKYSVKVKDQSGLCSDQDTVSIVYIPPFNFSIGKGSDTVCFNKPKTIQALNPAFNQGYTWSWKVPVGEIDPQNAISFSPKFSGNYIAVVTDLNGCRDSGRVAITYSGLLDGFDLGGPLDTVCFNVADTIQATDAKFNKGFDWSWTVPTGASNPNAGVYAVPTAEGIYKAVIRDQYACSLEDEVTIKYSNNLLDFDLGKSLDTICFNALKTIAATNAKYNSGYTWTWTVPAGANDPKGATSIVPITSGTYKVVISDSYKCSAIDTVLIRFSNLNLGFDLGGPVDTVCFNKADTIQATDSKFKSGYIWSWVVPTGVQNPGNATYLLPNESGLYKAQIQDAFNCKANDEVTIRLSNSLLDFDLGGPVDTVCFNSTFSIQATNAKYETGFAWAWIVPVGAVNPKNAVRFSPVVSGTYQVQITDDLLCIANDSVLVRFSDLTSGFNLGSPEDTACYGRADTIRAINPKFNTGYNWNWTVPTGVSDPLGATSILPDKGGVYKVTITDKFLCKNSDQVLVHFSNALIGFDLGNPADTVCFNVPDTIQALNSKFNKGFIWTWIVPSGADDPKGAVYTLPNASGKYAVTIFDSLLCSANDNVQISFGNSLLNFSLANSSGEFCALTQDTLKASDAKYNASVYTWNWTVPDGAVNPGRDVKTLPVIEGNYKVIVTDTLLCQANDEVTIKFLPPLKIDLGSKDTIACSYADYTINAGSGFVNYKWVNNVAGIHQSTFKPKSSGLYWVEVTDANGCKGRDSITVAYVPPVEVSLGNPEITVCNNNTVPVILTPGSNFTSYLWPDGSIDSLFTLSYPEDSSKTIVKKVWVQVTNLICKAADTITVNFINFESITLGDDLSVCSGDTVKLDAGPLFYSYYWTSSNDPGKELSDTRYLTVTKEGLYFLDVNNDCGYLRLNKKVNFYEKPDVNYQFVVSKYASDTLSGDTANFCVGEYVNLIMKSGYSSYKWTMKGNESDAVADSSVKKLDEQGTYYVTVASAQGCVSRDSVVLLENDLCFFIPNLITPNGDNYNQTFHVQGIKQKTWSLQIYNRWGEQVYTNPAYANEWEAENVTDGVYYYLLKNDKKQRSFKGWVQVVGNAHP